MCETPQPRHEIARGKNRNLGKAAKQNCGETSQKLSENTGKMLNKYPASFKQIRSVDNHTAADKNNRPTWKSREEILWRKTDQNMVAKGCVERMLRSNC